MKNTIILLTMLLFSGIGFAQESNNGKQLWAKSFLNEKAPELTVETWISKKPDTEGKFVIIDFWATWCGPCRSEMPDIQKLYETYETEGDNAVIILGVAAPGLGQEKDEAGIKAFLDESGYTYPTLMDTTGDLFSEYGISSFPTTFMIDREGNVFGYVSGALNEDMMKNIIEQTLEGKRK